VTRIEARIREEEIAARHLREALAEHLTSLAPAGVTIMFEDPPSLRAAAPLTARQREWLGLSEAPDATP
jgi:hypothetical protein